jgi:2-acylglycerol O-acyltransferase 2
MIFDDPETPNNPETKILLCYHPHGVMAYGVTILTFNFNYFWNFVRLGSRIALNIPWGGIVLKLGGIQGVNPQNLNDLMRKGQKLLMVPGGYEEATITNYKEDRVYVKDRKGFIKYALKYGYTVHPCYGFNENKAYYYLTFVKLGLILNKFKIPAVMFISKFLNILPNNDVSIYFVIGKGMKFPLNEKPTKEEIEHYHNLYIHSLRELFNKYKGKFGSSRELQIY